VFSEAALYNAHKLVSAEDGLRDFVLHGPNATLAALGAAF
jgi:hypothetical protein